MQQWHMDTNQIFKYTIQYRNRTVHTSPEKINIIYNKLQKLTNLS